MTCHDPLATAIPDAAILAEGEAIERLALRSLQEAAAPYQAPRPETRLARGNRGRRVAGRAARI
jgi:hypothetical protein